MCVAVVIRREESSDFFLDLNQTCEAKQQVHAIMRPVSDTSDEFFPGLECLPSLSSRGDPGFNRNRLLDCDSVRWTTGWTGGNRVTFWNQVEFLEENDVQHAVRGALTSSSLVQKLKSNPQMI